MNLFELFTLVKQLIEADHDLWLLAKVNLKIFISIDAQKEGVFIDTSKRVLSFPVGIREHTSAVNFILDKEALSLMINSEVPMSVLCEHNKISAFGDPETIFHASIFLTYIFSMIREVQEGGGEDIDSYSVH